MNEFLRFFDGKRCSFPMHLEIYYSSVMDWCISVYQVVNNCKIDILYVQDCDIELAFAKAQVELKKWFLEHDMGY